MRCDYNMTQQDSFHVKFYEPREGKLDGFSLLESLKNTKRRLQSDIFRKVSLQGPKKNKIIPRRTLLVTRARVFLFRN
jgi:hypothetical protein